MTTATANTERFDSLQNTTGTKTANCQSHQHLADCEYTQVDLYTVSTYKRFPCRDYIAHKRTYCSTGRVVIQFVG